MEKEKGLDQATLDYYYQKFYYNWDPLYGNLAWDDAIEASPVFQACMVIFNARELWGILPWSTAQDIAEAGKWDEYNADQLRRKLARHIFDCYEAVRSLVGPWATTDEEYYMKSDGVIRAKHILSSKFEDAIDIVRGRLCYFDPDDNTQDFDVLTILAIAEAHDVFVRVFVEEISEDDPDVLRAIHDAELLLRKAELLKSFPYTEIGIKVKEQFKSVQDARQDKTQHRHAEWLRIAKDVKAKKIRRTLRGIALLVHKRVEDPETHKPKLDTIYKFLLLQNM